jgi:PAS domain S-box-containing protein
VETKLKILHLEDLQSDMDLVDRELKKGKFEFEKLVVSNRKQYEEALASFHPDIILSDHSIPAFNSVEALRIARERIYYDVPFILVTGTVSEDFAVEMMKKGIYDYILKDRIQRLPQAVLNAIEKKKVEVERQKFLERIVENESLMEEAERLAHFGSWQVDLIRKKMKWSNEVYRILGHGNREIEPTLERFLKYVHPEDSDYVNDAFFPSTPILENTLKLNYRIRDNFNHIKFVRCEVFIERNQKQEPIRMIGFILDVTEIQRAEEEKRKAEQNLKTAYEMLMFHLENTPLGFIEWDSNLKIRTASKRAEEIFGWSMDDFIESKESEFVKVYSEDLISTLKLKEQMLNGNLSRSNIQIRNFKRDKSLIWCNWFNSVQKNREGKVISVMSLVQDITESKVAEEKLKESESFNKGVLASLSSHIAVVDKTGIVVAVNKAWEDFAKANGATSLERTAKGSNYFEVCERAIKKGDEVAGMALEGIKSVFNKEKTFFEMEYECHSPNAQRWFLMVVMGFGSEDDKVVTTHQDISERKKAEELLRQSRSNLKAIIENTEATIYSIDREFRYITFNQRLQQTIKAVYNVDINPGDLVFDLHSHGDQNETNFWKDVYTRAFGGEPLKFEKKYIVRDTENFVNFSIYPIWENDDVIGLSCYAVDITKEKLDEIFKDKLSSDVMQRNKNLEQFSYIVSHNLRSPVANIIGLTSVLHEDGLDARMKKEMLTGLFSSVNKLDDVIKDLNQILQIKKDVSEKSEWLLISSIVKDIETSLGKIVKDEDALILYDKIEHDRIFTIKSYLYSILYNLILNSLKYRRKDVQPIIEVTSKENEKQLEIKVKDNGLGIDMKKKGDQVFGLYKRFHSETAEGKGMGLFMVKTQVESIGGRISLTSVVNEGTEFTIKLELTKEGL